MASRLTEDSPNCNLGSKEKSQQVVEFSLSGLRNSNPRNMTEHQTGTVTAFEPSRGQFEDRGNCTEVIHRCTSKD